MKRLVIVESPAKAKTIAGYLGPDFVVESSIGHIRDLPERAAEVPERSRTSPGAAWRSTSTTASSRTTSSTPTRRRSSPSSASRLKDADELLLATDEDREGEAIAWHLLEVLKPKVPVRRMVFHEIHEGRHRARARGDPRDRRTARERPGDPADPRPALRLRGLAGPLEEDHPRPVGRARQSVATRLVVERERAAWRSSPPRTGTSSARSSPAAFEARPRRRGRRAASPRAATSARTASPGKACSCSTRRERGARGAAGGPHVRRPLGRREAVHARAGRAVHDLHAAAGGEPQAPLLLADAMRVAQRLYENGYITYMRTDSVSLSETALAAARAQAAEVYGAETVPAAPRHYARQVANAQEAHEAIRPAGDAFRTPQQRSPGELSRDELALYDLIWKRTIASQMKDAAGQTVSIRLGADDRRGRRRRVLRDRHGDHVPRLPARLRVRPRRAGRRRGGAAPPKLEVGQTLQRPALEPQGTRPSRRPATRRRASSRRSRSAASAARRPTRRSWGRSSTAATSSRRDGSGAVVPGVLGRAAARGALNELVDYDFTARLEDDLDRIAAGDEDARWLGRFYFGGRRRGPAMRSCRLAGREAAQRAHRDRGARSGHRRARPDRAQRAVPQAGRADGERPGGPPAGRAHRGAGTRSCSRRPTEGRSLGHHPEPAASSSRARAATGRTSPRCFPRANEASRGPRRCSSRCPSTP